MQMESLMKSEPPRGRINMCLERTDASAQGSSIEAIASWAAGPSNRIGQIFASERPCQATF